MGRASNVVGEIRRPGSVRVGRSRVHGRGVFATMALPGRRKLGELAGRVVPRLGLRRAIRTEPVIYYVALNPRDALDCRNGNAFSHLNHSCEANCYLRVSGLRVEVYSLRPIGAREELTVDYGVTPHAGGMACHCGASSCRGRL